MSRARTLPARHRSLVQAFARRGERVYGLTHDDVVDHDRCAIPGKVLGDASPWIRCPCGGRSGRGDRADGGFGLTGQFVRNALRPGRPMSYRLAIDLLHLVNAARKTREWREARRKAGDPLRDRWLEKYGRYVAQLAIEGGLAVGPELARTRSDGTGEHRTAPDGRPRMPLREAD